MRIISALVCFYAILIRALQTYRRSGNPIYPAKVVGFKTNSLYAQDSWANVRVSYWLENEEIEAITIESVKITKNNLEKLQNEMVEIYVSSKNPYIVSLKGNHCLDFPCLIVFLIGLWGLFHY